MVVNRFDKSAPISLKDIDEALRCADLRTLPNDYAAVSQSQNTGVPLAIHAPRAPLTAAVRTLCQDLLGVQAGGQGLLKRTFGRLFRG
ncbi:hypothetical protein D3C78_1550230 [compost metagenome]